MNPFRTLVLLVAMLAAALGAAQAPDYGGKEQKEAMKKLARLVGTWKGEGYYEVGGAKRSFHGEEIVAPKCEGAILSVEGNHSMTMGGREVPVHSAFGMIFYDVPAKSFQFTAHLANGLKNTYQLRLTDTGYVWEQDHPTMGKVRYTAVIGPDTWTETGESLQGDKWTAFYQMNLKRQ